MRFITCLITAAGILGMLLIGTAGQAQAEDKCPAEEYVFSASKHDPPFQCGVHHWSSKKSIASWETKTWSSDTAVGYYFRTKCKYKSDSDITDVWGYAGPSFWHTFTNWDTGTRHFASGVIFTTGDTDSGEYSTDTGCANSDGKIKNALKKVTAASITGVSGDLKSGGKITVSGTVSPTDSPGSVGLMVDGANAVYDGKAVGAGLSSGKFTITWIAPIDSATKTYALSVGYAGSTSNCKQAASWCGWSPAESNVMNVTVAGSSSSSSSSTSSVASAAPTSSRPYGAALISSGLSSGASISSSASEIDPRVKLVNVTATTPHQLGARCPDGYSLLNAELWGGDSNRLLSYGSKGVSLKKGVIADGRKVGIQLTCRKSGKGLLNLGRVGFGTPKDDNMRAKESGALLMGGPGNDALVAGRKGVVNGGLGDDLLTLRKTGVAIGGAGRDMLRSLASGRTLMVGGPGRDRFIARGNARVDARDGQADRIVCKGGKVKVKADSVDSLDGACIRV